MKNLRNLMAAVTLAMVLMVGASTANAGILMSDLKDGNTSPCTETKVDWGIIVQGFTGIIVQGFTGIIVQGAVETNTDCGIIISDN